VQGRQGYDPSISKSHSAQPHRFFERMLSNDLSSLTEQLLERYALIEKAEVAGVTPVDHTDIWQETNSVSTMKWSQYNVFQFHIPEVINLYHAVSSMVKEACDYYEVDFDSQKFMIQGWFNVNYTKKGKLDWHDHAPVGAPFFHGYYSVSAEPSETHYYAFGEHKINHNVNNKAILSEMGHSHAMADWDWEGPRITIAYDVTPLHELIPGGVDLEQHWIPLA
jgi:hypothetical protein